MTVTLALAENNILSIDGSFLLIFVSVLILIFVLNRTLFKPIIRILDERDRLGVGRLKESRQMIAQYEKRLAEYENQIRAARASAFTDFESRRREFLAERTGLVNQTKEDIRGMVGAAKNEISVESAKARENLEIDARAMAANISSRLLRRPVSPSSSNEGVAMFLLAFALSPNGWPKFLNLVLFVVFLYYVLKKPAQEFFAKRLAEVRGTLDRAAREREEATSKLSDIDDRMRRIESEIAEIKTQSLKESDAERERIKRDTEREVERLKELSAREINIAKLGAIVELRKFAAEKAVDLAEGMIRKELTPADDKRLVERASEGLKEAR